MLWIKNHRLLTLSLLSVFASFSFCLFGFSSDSYATSQSFTYSYSDFPMTQPLFDSSRVGFSFRYVLIELRGTTNTNFFNGGTMYLYDDTSTKTIYLIPSSSGDLTQLFETNSYYYLSSRSNWGSSFTSLKLTFYDVLPSDDCPIPDPCPEIPETPYGDKLDKIYNAIMIAAGTMLVIYFFFAIYSLFFGGLRR